jgi:acyl-CoA dehydrogenase
VELARRAGRVDEPVVRQALVDAHIQAELLRFLRYRAHTALSQGRRPGSESSVMKLAYGRYMKALTETALAAQGAQAMLGARPDQAGGADRANGADRARGVGESGHTDTWLRRFLHAPSLRIAGGSDEVQSTIIGERVLGLPQEPRPGKHVPFRDLGRAGSGSPT